MASIYGGRWGIEVNAKRVPPRSVVARCKIQVLRSSTRSRTGRYRVRPASPEMSARSNPVYQDPSA